MVSTHQIKALESKTYLQLIRNEKEQKASLQQVDAEEERHEFQPRIILEDVVDGFSSTYRMSRSIHKALRGDPQVVVVEKGNRVPFSC